MKLPDLTRTMIRAALLLGAASAMPAAAQTVVAASGPSAARHPVGTKLPAAASLTLQSNDMVTLLDARGTRILRGPGTFPVAQASSGTRPSTYNTLISNRATQRVRTGSVRTGAQEQAVRTPNLWYVDVARPGTYCLVNPSAVRFWRATTGKALTVEVRDGAAVRPVSFAKADMVAPLSGAVEPGRDYEVLGANGKSVGSFRFVQIDTATNDMEALAASLITNGCSEQLTTLDASVRQSAS